ncbi:4943_t:CDS:2, partial [Gigaspora margarita]
EKATRPFFKKIFETWNSTNWRLTESILTLEPKVNNSKLDWHTYWKRIKKLKGTLATRRPEIYSFDSCIECNTGTSETQDHLAKCSYYKTTWQNIEKKYRCPKHLLHKILIGLLEADIQEKRRLWIKGLTSVDAFDAIKDLLNSSKTTAYTIELTMHIM